MDKPKIFRENYPAARPAVRDPVILLTAQATTTDCISLVATSTTSFDKPYSVARRFASLDHTSQGQANWNMVTASNAGDTLKSKRPDPVGRIERYDRAGKFIDLVKGQWDS